MQKWWMWCYLYQASSWVNSEHRGPVTHCGINHLDKLKTWKIFRFFENSRQATPKETGSSAQQTLSFPLTCGCWLTVCFPSAGVEASEDSPMMDVLQLWARHNPSRGHWGLLIVVIIYLFMAVLGLRFCARAFSSCGKQGPLFIAVRGPLTIVASPIAEHRLQTRRLSNCGARA